jgi:hypothetical protein
MKKMKQGHVSNRESVGGSLKVGEWHVVGRGGVSLSQARFRLFAFWRISAETV